MRRTGSAILALLLCAGCGGDSTETPAPPATAPAAPAEVSTRPVQSLEQLLQLADSQLQQGDANAALQSLTTAVLQYPQEGAPYIKRGALLADAGLLPAAIKDLSAAIELDPQNARLLNTRGYFFLLSKNYDWAYKDFSDAVGRDLQYPQPYNNRGLVHIAREDYVAAVKEFDAAIAIDPAYIDAHNNRGFALVQSGRTEEALVAFSKALELDGKYINALNNRGRAYHKLARFAEAVADFSAAIELNPGNLQYFAHRSEAYRQWGRVPESRLDAEHIARMQELQRLDSQLRHDPENSELWVSRGTLLAKDQQMQQAGACYDQAIKLSPQCSAAHIGKARLAAQGELWQQVLTECNVVLSVESNYEALSLRGDAHYKLQHLDEALADYAAAKRIDSQVAQAYKERAERYQQAGQAELAAADLRIAVAFDASLGNGEVVPASASVPALEPGRFPSAEELEAFRQQQSAEVVPAEQKSFVQ